MLELLAVVYAVNLLLLVLHEIESAYFKEWEIVRLPGGITGFLLLHVPLFAVLFFGLVEIARGSLAGLVVGLAAGGGGLLPLVVHKILVPRKDAFHLVMSNAVMALNALAGAALIALCIVRLAG